MILVENLEKSFGKPPTHVIKNISLKIEDGSFLAITGRSGSGKSTLLYLLSTLDQPSSGRVTVDGVNMFALESQALHRFRNQKMGFVFQFHYLLPELNALENVLMPARKFGQDREMKPRALELLESFEMSHRLKHKPSQLSGGEQQRVAIARALLMRPRYLFADEPTGNLDSVNGSKVLDLLERANREDGTTLIMVTHEPSYAARARTRIELVDGHL